MRALVFSGGGAKGAYQAAITSRLACKGREYDIFCGISVGAINAAFLAQYDNTNAAAAKLVKLWRKINQRKIYKPWWGWVAAALWKSSLYDSAPLREMIAQNISPRRLRESDKKLVVGAVSLDTGRYKTWDEGSGAIVSAVQASSAFPGVLTPVRLENALWMDGGARVMTPIKAAIQRGATEIDVVMTTPEDGYRKPPQDPNALEVTLATIDTMVDEIVTKDLQLAQLYNELAQLGATDKKFVKINVIRPQRYLGSTLDFSSKNIQKVLLQGFRERLVSQS